jgi:putative ABC transport system permease protein
MDKSLGYEKEHVVNIAGLETMDENKKLAFKQELLTISAVGSAALSDYLPVEGGAIQNRAFWVADRRQVDNGFEATRWAVDEDYTEAMGMDIASGRNFNTSSSDDQSIIINESMAKEFGLNDPVGTEIIDMFDQKYHIIGVVKDFYFESLFGNVRPLAMVREKGKSTLSVKLNTTDVQSAMASLATVWDKFKPDQAFRYSFMDQRFAKMYDELNRAKTIFILFSILSIVIACSGLFALSLYLIGQRSKEVSIRKVLGASVSKIFWLLSFDFVKLVIIAITIAVPVAWYFMDYLLADIANRIELS